MADDGQAGCGEGVAWRCDGSHPVSSADVRLRRSSSLFKRPLVVEVEYIARDLALAGLHDGDIPLRKGGACCHPWIAMQAFAFISSTPAPDRTA